MTEVYNDRGEAAQTSVIPKSCESVQFKKKKQKKENNNHNNNK